VADYVGSGSVQSKFVDVPFVFHTTGSIDRCVAAASKLFGGGYVLHQGISYRHWLWSVDEQNCFVDSEEHINVLELAVLVLAVLANVDHLKDCCVHAQIDNTSALCWINAMRSKTPTAQPWIKLLLLTCVSYYIHIFHTFVG
jgi:hypothetical protein